MAALPGSGLNGDTEMRDFHAHKWGPLPKTRRKGEKRDFIPGSKTSPGCLSL